MKYMWRKLREDQDNGDPSPMRDLHGDMISLADVKEHFRKKNKQHAFEDLPTPTRDEAPSPLNTPVVVSRTSYPSLSQPQQPDPATSLQTARPDPGIIFDSIFKNNARQCRLHRYTNRRCSPDQVLLYSRVGCIIPRLSESQTRLEFLEDCLVHALSALQWCLFLLVNGPEDEHTERLDCGPCLCRTKHISGFHLTFANILREISYNLTSEAEYFHVLVDISIKTLQFSILDMSRLNWKRPGAFPVVSGIYQDLITFLSDLVCSLLSLAVLCLAIGMFKIVSNRGIVRTKLMEVLGTTGGRMTRGPSLRGLILEAFVCLRSKV